MNNDEALAQLRSMREAVARMTRDVDAAIAHLEAFQPVAEAFQRRQAAAAAQWEDLMRAGGPDNLDVETQMRHAAEVRAAEVSLMSTLRTYLSDAPQQGESAQASEEHEMHATDEHQPEQHHKEYHPS